ncbi:MAG: homoprotocatechuate degradation operon regulator HpaR [Notoacmeibacter sp.]|nr:homoprotocatechuate degradation operon regulator HpaR [Notoacmeibacter sp.]MCC0031548.1 homoprotocatechuate degradation operon regulator HpaR [Brucellaceae bacterium]
MAHDDTAPRGNGGPPATSRSLPIALLRAREAVMGNFRPMLADFDVTEQQWRVMRVLSEAGRLDASDLAARASILAPSLTRILKTLEDRAWVQRERDASDGRRSWLALTRSGHGLIAEVAPRSREIYDTIERRFGAERVETLLDLLNELGDAMRRD